MARPRIGLYVSAVILALLLVAATPANAFESYYYCSLKPTSQWCDGRANGTYDGLHSWDMNEAWYPGTWDGTVTACQRVYRPSTGGTLPGSGCAANYTKFDYGNVTCVCYEANAMQVSGGPHTIWGHADADY